MVRRVRTAAGVSRYDKPIGTPISRVKIGRGENIVPRSLSTAGQRVQGVRERIKAVDVERQRALAGRSVPVTTAVLYSSPRQIAEAKRLRGHIVKPRGEALVTARGRTTSQSAQRAVAFNSLAGRFTVAPAYNDGSRQVTRASAGRAKSARVPVKPVYVGRRRA